MWPASRDAAPLPWGFDPLEALRRWPADRRPLLLHSGRHHRRWARWSLLTEATGTYRFTPDGQSRWLPPVPGIADVGEMAPAPAFTHRPFDDLRMLLRGTFPLGAGANHSGPRSTVGSGLWVGYLSYDLGRWVEKLPTVAAADRDWPIIELGWCPGWAVYDLETGRWQGCGTWREHPPVLLAPAESTGGQASMRTADLLTAPPRSVFTASQYQAAVQRVRDYIAAGDVFQVNLSQRFTAGGRRPWPEAGRALFSRLAAASPAWYGAYLELAPGEGGAERALASTSPELFLQVDGRHVVTRPIKGTRPASVPAGELAGSAKDIAELNMIVDLLRNDLGRVCDYGSVRVTAARDIESHPTVHHGVATIEGELHASKDLMDLLRAAMPGGSVTGAPKVRAMQIIEELEPVRRGPYCGCLGVLSRDAACLNLAIRTMSVEARGDQGRPPGAPAGRPVRIDFAVGGGVVADSDPAAEYRETLDKAAAMLRALGLPAAPDAATNGP